MQRKVTQKVSSAETNYAEVRPLPLLWLFDVACSRRRGVSWVMKLYAVICSSGLFKRNVISTHAVVVLK